MTRSLLYGRHRRAEVIDRMQARQWCQDRQPTLDRTVHRLLPCLGKAAARGDKVAGCDQFSI